MTIKSWWSEISNQCADFSINNFFKIHLMELHELNDLSRTFNFPLDKLATLADQYPSAKKEFVEQILSYVKNHGMTFSYAMNMMKMDTAFLQFLGFTKAEGFNKRLVPEVA